MGGTGGPDWVLFKVTFGNATIEVTNKYITITVGDKTPTMIPYNTSK